MAVLDVLLAVSGDGLSGGWETSTELELNTCSVKRVASMPDFFQEGENFDVPLRGRGRSEVEGVGDEPGE